MTLVFVAKDMQVANPVGRVNLHPLPDLPSGLYRMHLLRQSLSVLNLNLVDGARTEFTEYRGYETAGGEFTYDDTSIHSAWGTSGWIDPSWDIPYTDGFTMMAVAFKNNEIHRIISSGDYKTSGGGGLVNFNFATNNGDLGIGGTGSGYTRTSVGGASGPIMVFGSCAAGSAERSVFAPHANSFNAESFDVGEDPPAVVNGAILVGAQITQANQPRDSRLFMAGQWNRVLSQSEMLAAYDALRPWLLKRGVSIA